MFFEREDVLVTLLDVLYLEQSDIRIVNTGRNFDALSFRYEADTVIKTDTENLQLYSNTVGYFPARVQYTRIAKHDRMIVVHFNGINLPTGNIQLFHPQDPQILRELFQKLLDCWTQKKKGYKYACTAIFYRILEVIYKQAHADKEADTIIGKGVAYIKENFAKPDITVKAAAKYANVSEVYFRKLFKEQFGISPRKYIMDTRIKHAVSLIESGYYPLGEISAMLGFSDYKYFSVAFHKMIGVPPSQYQYRFTAKERDGEMP